MAFRDDLTKIPSRRALNEAIYGLGRKYAVAMVDIDHFKNFNDTYGHDVGDQVLRLVAKMLLEVEGGGKAYRYGGEEFTIIFSNKCAEDTIEHLERVRKKIADYKVVIRGNDRPKDQKSGKSRRGNSDKDIVTSVTISIGVADSTEKLETAAEVIKAADKALYKAKNRGRNQVCKS
jgi:diguanylate cyclase (GGDEF)-like protein